MIGGKCHDCTELLFQEITSIALEEFGVLEGVRGAKEHTSGGVRSLSRIHAMANGRFCSPRCPRALL